jgi:hypothetical protein
MIEERPEGSIKHRLRIKGVGAPSLPLTAILKPNQALIIPILEYAHPGSFHPWTE